MEKFLHSGAQLGVLLLLLFLLPFTSEGQNLNVLDFSKGDYLNLPADSFPMKKGTITYWFNIDDDFDFRTHVYIGSNYSPLSKMDGFGNTDTAFEFHIHSIKTFNFFLNEYTNILGVFYQNGHDSISGNANHVKVYNSLMDFPNNKWNFVALSYDESDSIKVFVNGKQVIKTDISFIKKSNNKPYYFRVGIPAYTQSSRKFSGFFDDLRVYDKPLSRNEVRQKMHASLKETGTLANNLTYYYNFDSSTIHNLGYSKLNGTNNGAARIKIFPSGYRISGNNQAVILAKEDYSVSKKLTDTIRVSNEWWEVTGGAIVNTFPGKDKITVSWGNKPGNYEVLYIIDYSNSGFNDTIRFPVTVSSNITGPHSVKLDGVNDYINVVNSSINFSQSFTLEGWFNPEGLSGIQNLFSKWDEDGNNRELKVRLHNNRLVVYSSSNGTSVTDSISISNAFWMNKWNHLAISANKGSAVDNIKIYINGNLAGKASWSSLPKFSAADFNIGAEEENNGTLNKGATANFFPGFVDEIRVWKKALDLNALQTLKYQRISFGDTYYTDLAGYYQFDLGTGTKGIEYSLSSGTVTLVGGSSWQKSSFLNPVVGGKDFVNVSSINKYVALIDLEDTSRYYNVKWNITNGKILSYFNDSLGIFVKWSDSASTGNLSVSFRHSNWDLVETSPVKNISIQNTKPELTPVKDILKCFNVGMDTVSFSYSDKEYPADSLVFNVSSSNQALLPDANIEIFGKGTNSRFYLNGLKDSSGTTLITFSVSDGELDSVIIFKYTVYGEFDPGTISAYSETCTNMDASKITGINPPAGGGGKYKYQWQDSVSGSGWNNITGGIGKNYLPGRLTESTWFRRTVKSLSGCGVKITNISQVTVNETPSAALSFSGQCEKDSVFFSDNSTISSGTINKLTWNFGNSTTGTGSNPVVFYDKSGNYPVRLIAESTNNCKDTADAVVTIFPKPVAIFNYSTACIGRAVEFTDASTTGGATTIDSFYWDLGNGKNSSLKNPTSEYSTAGNYTVKEYVLTSAGCSDTTEKTIEVNINPVAGLSASDACLTDTVFLTNLTKLSTGTFSNSWIIDGNTVSTTNDYKAVFNSAKSYSVKLITLSDKGCSDTAVGNFTVDPLPALSFSTNDICLGDSLKVTNNSSNVKSWKWDVSDGSVYTSLNFTHDFSSSGKFDVSLSAISADGCRDTLVKMVRVNALPLANISAGDVCLGDTTYFSHDGKNIKSTKWAFGDSSFSVKVAPAHLYAEPGPFNVSLEIVDNNGCYNTLAKSVNVNESFKAAFTSKANCAGDTSLFFSLASGSSSNTWIFPDTVITGPSEIKKVFPSGGNYQVTYITGSSAGCKDSISKTVSIPVRPTAGFSFGTACENRLIAFTNKSTGSGNLSYSWDFGDGNYSISANPIQVYSGAGKYVVKQIVSSSNGCADTLLKNIQVGINPVSSFEMANGCEGDTVIFTNKSTISSGTLNYIWNIDDSTFAKTKDISRAFSRSGAYDIELIAVSDLGCSDSLEKNIRIYSLPDLKFTPTPVCANEPVTINNFSPAGASYNWNMGDGTVYSTYDVTHSYSSGGTYDITLVGITSNGCKDSLTQNITVFDVPEGTIVAKNICLGDSAEFSFTGKNIKKSNWAFGDNSFSINPSPVHYYQGPGIFPVSLFVENTSGCRDTFEREYHVFKNPVANFTTNEVCLGDTTILVSTSSQIKTHTWIFTDTAISGEKAVRKFEIAGKFLVQYVAGTDSGCLDTATGEIIVNENPVAGFKTDTFCLNEEHIFKNTSSGNSLSFNWDLGDGNTSTVENPVKTYSAIDAYTVTLEAKSDKGCVDTFSAIVDVKALPVVNFGFKEACLGDTILFTADVTSPDSIATYNWIFGKSGVSNDKDPAHIFFTPGDKDVTLTAVSIFGCEASVTKTVFPYPKPLVFFNAPIEACTGEEVIFKNESIVPQGIEEKILWTFNGKDSSDQDLTSLIFDKGGNVKIKLIVSSNKGCVDSVEGDILINTTPELYFPNDTVCNLEPVSFMLESSNCDAYSWDFGDGFGESKNENPSYIYMNPGGYDVQVIGTNVFNCADTFTGEVLVGPDPVADFAIANACSGENILLKDLSRGKNLSFKWFVDGKLIEERQVVDLRINDPGKHMIKLVSTTDFGCSDSVDRSLEIYPLPEVNVTPDTVVAEGETLLLAANGGKYYEWGPAHLFDDPNSSTPKVTINKEELFTLKVENNLGCVKDTFVRVTLNGKKAILPSNYFTPDGNNINDYWQIRHIDLYPDVNVLVFDRWGRKIFESNGYAEPWDGNVNGSPMPAGTYYYVIRYNENENISGAVSILRD